MLRLLPLLLPLMLLLLLLLLLQEVGEDYKYLLKLEPKKQKIIGGNFFSVCRKKMEKVSDIVRRAPDKKMLGRQTGASASQFTNDIGAALSRIASFGNIT